MDLSADPTFPTFMMFIITTKQSSLGSKVKVSLIFKQGLPNLNSVDITHHGQLGSRVENAHLWPSEGTMDLIKSKAPGSSTPFAISSVLHFSVGCHRNMSLYTKVGPNPLKPVWELSVLMRSPTSMWGLNHIIWS